MRVRTRLQVGPTSLIVAILAGSWFLVYFTNGTSQAYVYSFFIAVILGARYWGTLGGTITGVMAGILAGPLMPLSVHPLEMQALSNWLIRLGVFLVVGNFIGVLFARMKKQNEKLESFGTDLIIALAHTIELRDPYTNGHCERVAKMSREIGRHMKLSPDELRNLYWSGLIHDIGKIAIPERILSKPGKLTPQEYNLVKQHPSLGQWVLEQSTHGHLFRDGVISHHERWDGRGYPNGLSGVEIPLQGRIMAVADTWDAISTDRPYRNRFPYEQCVEIMKNGRGTQFDPEILDIFLTILELRTFDPSREISWAYEIAASQERQQGDLESR